MDCGQARQQRCVKTADPAQSLAVNNVKDVIGQFKLLLSDEPEESVFLPVLGEQSPGEVDEEGDCDAGECIGNRQFVELLTNVCFPTKCDALIAGAMALAAILACH